MQTGARMRYDGAMKIAIFGGTGRAGQLLLADTLAAGHGVAVLARTPARLHIIHERLRVIQGDALDPARVRETVAGAAAVISLLGPQKDAPPRMVSRATANLLAAARAANARRVLIVTCDNVRGEARVDMRAAAAAVAAADLDWTLVCVPRLADDPAQWRAGRGQLAAFLLRHVDDPTFIRKATVVSDM